MIVKINAGLVNKGDEILIVRRNDLHEYKIDKVIANNKHVFNLPTDTVYCTVNGKLVVDFLNTTAG